MQDTTTHHQVVLASEDRSLDCLLQRHFSTIGMGDVFVNPPSCLHYHPLPKDYHEKLILSSTSISSSSSDTNSFLSWEFVGTIKATPQDFCVREIGGIPFSSTSIETSTTMTLSQRSARVAAITCDYEPVNDTNENDTHQSTVHDVPEIPTNESPESIHTPPEKDTQNTVKNDTVQDKDPLQVLKELLSSHTVQGSDVLIHDIDQLHETALDRLGSRQTHVEKSPTVSFDIVSSSSSPLHFDRGAFHRSFRAAYPLLKVSTEPTTTMTRDDIKFHVQIAIDTLFEDLIPALQNPRTDLLRLYAFIKRGYVKASRLVKGRTVTLKDTTIASQQALNGTVTLRLRPDLPKDERRSIHFSISSKTALTTSTISEYPLDSTGGSTTRTTAAIVVRWSDAAGRRHCKKRKLQEPMTRHHHQNQNPHCLFVLKKTQVEHLMAIQALVTALKCRQAQIGLAGIKDMQAVTYQFCTIRQCSPERVMRAKSKLAANRIEIGNLQKVDWVLSKACLQGNRFEIVVRNIQRIRVSVVQKHVHETLRDCTPEHIAAMVERIKTGGFVNFYGEQRVGCAGPESIVGVRSSDIGKAMLQQNFAKAVDLLLTGRLMTRGSNVESDALRDMRKIWRESGGDPVQTWKALPNQVGQASRERIVLKGLKRYGRDQHLSALRCIHFNERVFYISAYQALIWNKAATERLQKYGCKVIPGDLIQSADGSIEIVTETTVSIKDVVLPLPGYDIQYPRNEIGDFYKNILDQDLVSFRKDAPPESTAKGSYRRLLSFAENVSHEILTDDKNSSLHCKLTFDLPKGSYATMLLRELMLQTCTR